jgi:hypothetical protein
VTYEHMGRNRSDVEPYNLRDHGWQSDRRLMMYRKFRIPDHADSLSSHSHPPLISLSSHSRLTLISFSSHSYPTLIAVSSLSHFNLLLISSHSHLIFSSHSHRTLVSLSSRSSHSDLTLIPLSSHSHRRTPITTTTITSNSLPTRVATNNAHTADNTTERRHKKRTQRLPQHPSQHFLS